jgi:hypothetical protein
MIEMGVGQEKVGVDLILERISQVAQAGAAVEDEQPPAAAHLDARGIAAVADRARPGARDGAAHPPEAQAEVRGHGPTIAAKKQVPGR